MSELQTIDSSQSNDIFLNEDSFNQAQRIAMMLSKSKIVPSAFQGDGNIPNVIVALEIAFRMKESPLMIMQNLDIIQGKPSFSSKFIISRLNTCGKFSQLRFKYKGEGMEKECFAYANDLANDEIINGPSVTMKMAQAEGWLSKGGSKWKTMPDLMLMYRSAAFFGRVYAPELLMGMQTLEEIKDVHDKPEKATEEDRAKRFIETCDDAKKLSSTFGADFLAKYPDVEIDLNNKLLMLQSNG